MIEIFQEIPHLRPQYKAMRKVTGGYHGATLENIARIEPVPVQLWDMRMRASARILEKGVQDNLIEEVEKHRGTGRSWKDHSLAWAQKHRQKQYKMGGILAWNSAGEPATTPAWPGSKATRESKATRRLTKSVGRPPS